MTTLTVVPGLPPGKLRVTVTYLEMTAPAPRPPARPPVDKLALLRVERPTVPYYRFLYNLVGEGWLWTERRRLSDEALLALITRDGVEIFVLYVAGSPAGFIELDRHRRDQTTRIAYFGMMPEFIGRGLGPLLLGWGVERAWTGGTRKLLVNTCTLDHPRALSLYQRAGFVPVRQVVRIEDDPRLCGLVPRHAAPHVPLAAPLPPSLPPSAPALPDPPAER